jgi:hypothetical protein
MLTPKPQFPHRRNKNFGYDSFCATCFATVGSEQNEDALVSHEAAHVCNPIRLAGGTDIPRFLLAHDRQNSENGTA